MRIHIQKTTSFAALAGVFSLLTLSATYAQTYTWDQQALGQLYLQCQYFSSYWPNNGNWTQSYQTNGNCNGTAILTSAPSNWDPTPPLGLYPGGPGLQGVNVIIGGLVNGTNIAGGANTYLQGSATVNNLTLQTNGSLNLGYITTLTANNVDIQGDTIIGPGSYAGGLRIAAGGSLTKSGGTNTLGFGVDGYGNAVGLQAVNASLVVKSGTFAMPYKGAGSWLDGTFSVSNNATVLLNVTNGSGCTLGGNITGVGGGVVLMTDYVNAGGGDFYGTNHPGLMLNFPGKMFQWSGGVFRDGPVTNAGVFNLTNSPGLQAALYNNGTMNLADNSSFGLSGGGGDIIYNNAGSIFNIHGNSSITGSGQAIINFGLFLKSAGAGVAQITQIFQNYGGTIEADSGTLDLNMNSAGYYTNTTLVVSNGAAIDFLTNNSTMEIEGRLTGTGGGTVLMNNGTVFSYHPTTLNFPGAMFQWQGGSLGGYSYSGYQPLTNASTVNVGGPVGIYGSIENSGAMIQSGAGAIGNGVLFNDAGAVYDIQNDNGLSIGSIYNYGLIKKSAGTGTSIIAGNLGNYGTNVPVEVDSGTLVLSGVGNNYFTNATLVISNGATLDFEAVYSPNYATEIEGYLNGVGGGTLLVTNGTLYSQSGDATLNFPGSMFQWLGGVVGYVNNIGTINIGGPVAIYAWIANNGTMIQSGAGGISYNGNTTIYNYAGAVYDIQDDNGITVSSLYNYGLIKKSTGTGTSLITANLYNYGTNATVEVDSGTVALNGGNYFTNTALVAGNKAVLDLFTANNSTEIEGYLNGSGIGTVLMTNGTLYCNQGTTLNFPGSMFQWQGGQIGNTATSSPLLTNAGTLNISGPVKVNGYLANNGTMTQSGAGAMGSGFIKNTGVYDIQNDNGVSLNNFNNYALVKKSAGTGTSQINSSFYNAGSTLEVDSGVLALSGGGNNYFTNSSFVVNKDATLDFSAVSSVTYGTEIEGYLTGSGGGSGAGTVLVTNGTIYSSFPATLNLPGSMFQWAGGRIGNNYNTLTNVGTLNVSGPVGINNYLVNNGMMIQSGIGGITSGNQLQNNANGVYNIQNDGGVSANNFYNYGLFEKTSGAGTSIIGGTFNNSGPIQASSGVLLFTNGTFVQNAGTLQLSSSLSCQDTLQVNGGTVTGVGTVGNPGLDVSMVVNAGVLAPGNPFGTLTSGGHYGFGMGNAATLSVALGGATQFSQLAVIGGSAALAGTLNVTLTNGYAPAIGTQFQIISGNRGSSTFATLKVPQGISVTYSNAGVYLTVTGAVPAQVVSPQISSGNFTFGFGTTSGQSYTVQQNTNLAATNWSFYTNITGNGSPYQFTAPVTNIPQRFFRVSEP
jgi:fibronectin-binding autotransporter adhesin